MEEGEQEVCPVYLKQFPFRFVQPYAYTFKTFTKGRWVGKPILHTLTKEFKAYSPEYYELALQTGKITVNSKQVPPDYILRNGDAINHQSLRVQPPVLDLPIQILDQSQDYLVVNKPPSIIVHTGGGYHFNTIQNLLKYQHHYNNLHILHRLDKCTSGVLIFAKNKAKVALFHEESGKETMKKMYYARVAGLFPWQEKQLLAYIECVSHKDGVYRVTEEIHPEKEPPKQEINNQEESIIHQKKEEEKNPIKKVEQKFKNDNLKDSKTLFKKVWYDEVTDSSLLECFPATGRTHQIRVHLQFLGFPILNDVVYGGRFVGNKIIETIVKPKMEEEGEEGETPKKKVKMSEQLRAQEWDYESKPWQIMLHSFKYKFGGREFQTSEPYWFLRSGLSSKA